MSEPRTTAGIDVGKDHLDLATVPPGPAVRFPNTPDGCADLATRLAGIRLVVLGRHAKTDRLDAAVLAEFAARIEPTPTAAPDPEREALAAVLTRRRQLLDRRVLESNRRRPNTPAAGRAEIDDHLAWLDERLAEADRARAAALRRSPVWRAEDNLLRSLPGIGPVVSRTLIADLPELGTGSADQLVARVGLAPFAADRGTRSGRRHIRGGRSSVRRALERAAPTAARVPGPLKTFADKLKTSGKAVQVVLVAVARRLLVIAHAVVRDGRPWTPALAAARG